MKILLEYSANVNANNASSGKTTLGVAASKGRLTAAKMLVGHRATLDGGLFTPLYLAVLHGQVEMARYLATQGASGLVIVSQPRRKKTLSRSMTKLLLSHGASSCEIKARARTLLWFASSLSDVKLIKYLLGCGTEVDVKDQGGRTAFMRAIEWHDSCFARASLLLARGACVDGRDAFDNTALFNAITSTDLFACEWLLQHGASVNAINGMGRTSLFHCCDADQDLQVVKLLMTSGASINHRDENHDTALLTAGRAGQCNIFSFLAKAGANANVQAFDGETPFLLAARLRYPDCIETFIQQGGSIHHFQIDDHQASILPTTLNKMLALCSEATEFREMFEHAVIRMQDACVQLQDQEAALLDLCEVVAFAKAVYNCCRLILKHVRKPDPLSRFLCSRAMTSAIEDIHDGLNHYIRQPWIIFDENGLMMRKSRNRSEEAATLLMNELKNSSDFYDINGLEVVQGALNRLIRICGLQAPSLPEWFVPRNNVEILDDHTEGECFALPASVGKTFDGRYKNMNAILTKIGVNQIKSFASRWYPLRHPLVGLQKQQAQIAMLSISDYIVPEFAATIKEELQKINLACLREHDDLDSMTLHIHSRLTSIYSRLVGFEKAFVDPETVAFCAILYIFSRYLWTHITKDPVIRFERSRKVAHSSHIIHSRIDRLLDVLRVSVTNPLRGWKPTFENHLQQLRAKENTFEAASSKEENEAVSLVVFRVLKHEPQADDQSLMNPPSPRSSPQSGASHPDGRDTLADRRPWFLHLSELEYKEVDPVGEDAFGSVYKRLFGVCHIGKRYFVCEHASKGSLAEYLHLQDNKDAGILWQKLYEVALGVEYLDGQGVVHNDLKSGNILVGADPTVKLIDFGLASIPNNTEIMVKVKTMRALHWKLPEYLVGGRPTCASDVYSLAMCILEIVTRDIPWERNMQPGGVRFYVRKGNIPHRPEMLTDVQWDLIKQMTKPEPFVVQRLQEFTAHAKKGARGG